VPDLSFTHQLLLLGPFSLPLTCMLNMLHLDSLLPIIITAHVHSLIPIIITAHAAP